MSLVMSRPSTRALPEEGSKKPVRMLMDVLLPAPLGPWGGGEGRAEQGI